MIRYSDKIKAHIYYKHLVSEDYELYTRLIYDVENIKMEIMDEYLSGYR